MSVPHESKPPPLPATTAEGESAALDAQILKAGNTMGDIVIETAQDPKDDAAKAKKVPEAGLANYFVSILRMTLLHPEVVANMQ